jgi:hypothetical protein
VTAGDTNTAREGDEFVPEDLIHRIRVLVLALVDARTTTEHDRTYEALVDVLDELELVFVVEWKP